MEQAVFAPFPHMSWLGTWRATGRSEANIEFGMRQVAHTLIGRRCEPGHRFYTLLIPRGHLVHLADTEGTAAIPELRHSVYLPATHQAQGTWGSAAVPGPRTEGRGDS